MGSEDEKAVEYHHKETDDGIRETESVESVEAASNQTEEQNDDDGPQEVAPKIVAEVTPEDVPEDTEVVQEGTAETKEIETEGQSDEDIDDYVLQMDDDMKTQFEQMASKTKHGGSGSRATRSRSMSLPGASNDWELIRGMITGQEAETEGDTDT